MSRRKFFATIGAAIGAAFVPTTEKVEESIDLRSLSDEELYRQIDLALLESADYPIVTNYPVRWETIGPNDRLLNREYSPRCHTRRATNTTGGEPG